MAFEDRARLWKRFEGCASPSWWSSAPPVQMRRGLREQARREDQRGERILLVNRNDNLKIDPLRERASQSNSRRRASRGSRVTTASSGQSGTLVSITLQTALNCERIPAFGATRMLGNDSPGCNPGMSTALSVYIVLIVLQKRRNTKEDIALFNFLTRSLLQSMTRKQQ